MENLVDPKFWRGKRVLVTGHTGFKGSWLSIWLKNMDVDLTGFSKDIPTNPSLFELAKVKQGMNSVKGDIRNLAKVLSVIKENKPEIIIHLAAQSLVSVSYQNPLDTYSTNITGTANILESVRKTDFVKTVLIVTSDKCYENKQQKRGYKETDPMGGHDPYSSSKGCTEILLSSYRRSFFNPDNFRKHKIAIASARAGNVIGGGDWSKDRLFPDIIRSVINKTPINIRNPYGTRPWQFVLEPLSGYMILVQKLWKNGKEFSEGWNFGPQHKNCRSVEWILNEISRLWNRKVNYKIVNKSFYESNLLLLDCSKAYKKLGWFPKMDLKTTIEWTIEWYENHMQKKDLKAFSEKQIADYISLKLGTKR